MKLAVCFFIFSCAMHAQVAGKISGFVRDPTGAVITDASVTAISSEQQLRRTTASDSTGFYELIAMPPGTYDITVEKPGFERQLQTGVMLTSGQSLRLD